MKLVDTRMHTAREFEQGVIIRVLHHERQPDRCKSLQIQEHSRRQIVKDVRGQRCTGRKRLTLLGDGYRDAVSLKVLTATVASEVTRRLLDFRCVARTANPREAGMEVGGLAPSRNGEQSQDIPPLQ